MHVARNSRDFPLGIIEEIDISHIITKNKLKIEIFNSNFDSADHRTNLGYVVFRSFFPFSSTRTIKSCQLISEGFVGIITSSVKNSFCIIVDA